MKYLCEEEQGEARGESLEEAQVQKRKTPL